MIIHLMGNMMKKFQLVLMLVVFSLAGCVTGTRTIELNTPDYSNEESASGSVYIASIEDNRAFEHKPGNPSTPSVKGDLSTTPKEKLSTLIGRQRNGYGGAMGNVALAADMTMQDKVRELLTEGFESRGYRVVDDENATIKISADVQKFWAWFTPGFSSFSFEANLQC